MLRHLRLRHLPLRHSPLRHSSLRHSPLRHLSFCDPTTRRYLKTIHSNATIFLSPHEKGLKFDSNRFVVNSLKSHCLLDYAKSVGKQNEMAEVLFQDYFRHAKRIDKPEVLKAAAESCGLDWSAATQHMSNPDVVSRVKREAATASASGINGVPHFNVYLTSDRAKAMQFSGAQPAATILNVFQKLLNFAKSRV